MSGFIKDENFPVKAVLIGTAAGAVIILVILSAICGVLTATSSIPYRLLPYLVLIADAGGALCGAYTAAAIHKSRGLILGLSCGFILFVILFSVGMCSGGTIGLPTLLKAIVLIVFGVLGGILGVNKKERLHIR